MVKANKKIILSLMVNSKFIKFTSPLFKILVIIKMSENKKTKTKSFLKLDC